MSRRISPCRICILAIASLTKRTIPLVLPAMLAFT
jgi:hypothetical protein